MAQVPIYDQYCERDVLVTDDLEYQCEKAYVEGTCDNGIIGNGDNCDKTMYEILSP